MIPIIRKAILSDAEAILGIYAPYITDTCISFETEVPAIGEFTDRIVNTMRLYPYLVCEYEGKIVGYTYASKHRERAAYKYSADVSVYVASEYQRQGIGRALYTKLFELLREQGVYTAYAGVTLPNDKSVGLLKSFGFKEVGVYHNVGYKHDKWLNVLWMEKPLMEYSVPKENKPQIAKRNFSINRTNLLDKS